jgi:hypothetical protein
MAKFFGWFQPKEDENKNRNLQALPKDENNDGALELASGFSGWIGHGINFNETPTEDEVQLISKYREISVMPEIDKAVDDIINEMFSYTDDDYPVAVNLDHIDSKILPEKTKKKIIEEFNGIQDLLNFKNDCYEIGRRWYVDGRIFFQKIIDTDKPEDGVQELRYIDPRKIKKIRHQLDKKNEPAKVIDGIEVNKEYIEYYLYNPMGVNTDNPQGIRITLDTIVFIHSGIHDRTNKLILSHLNKAIRPLNQLNMIENSLVIYRLARAPERRVFNIEVGKLPRPKVEEYMNSVKNMHRRKMMYDASSGALTQDTRYMTMLEDFWFPQRDGKGTKVEFLQGGQNLGELRDVDWFRDKLIEALNVPHSRFEKGTGFNLGRASEISRDEIKFSKFITRLRKRFNALFTDVLGAQLTLKGILTQEEWDEIVGLLIFDYQEDNHFAEFKNADIWTQRFATFQQAKDAVTERYLSRKWVRDNIFKITDEEWDQMQQEIEEEKEETDDIVNAQLGGQTNNPQLPAPGPHNNTPAPFPAADKDKDKDKNPSDSKKKEVEEKDVHLQEINEDRNEIIYLLSELIAKRNGR